MGGFGMGPPPPMTTRPEPVEVQEGGGNDDDNRSVSDIVSTADSEVREVSTGDAKKRRGRPPGSKNRKELSL